MAKGRVLGAILGVLLIIGGVAGAAYIGIWLMFVGGIVDIIEQIRAEVLEPIVVVVGIVKILFAGVVGQLCAVFFVTPGLATFAAAIER